MYNTPLGVRVVRGAERALVSDALGMMVDHLRLMEHEFGIDVFDNLTRNQQIGILHVAGRALLCGDEPPPPLTAVLEGAVAAIYEQVRMMLSLELDEPEGDRLPDPKWGLEYLGESGDHKLPTWRARVFSACRELEVGGNLPSLDSRDRDDWDLSLESLEDCVLWDTDWGLAELLDAKPDAGRRAKSELGIDDEYFVAIAPDPNDEQARYLLADLIRLTPEGRRLDPDDTGLDFEGTGFDLD